MYELLGNCKANRGHSYPSTNCESLSLKKPFLLPIRSWNWKTRPTTAVRPPPRPPPLTPHGQLQPTYCTCDEVAVHLFPLYNKYLKDHSGAMNFHEGTCKTMVASIQQFSSEEERVHAGKRIWTEPLAAAQANAASVHSLSWFRRAWSRKKGRGKAWMEWAHATHTQEGIFLAGSCCYGYLKIWLCVRTACVQKYTSWSIRVHGTIICCISSFSAPPYYEFRANFFRL